MFTTRSLLIVLVIMLCSIVPSNAQESITLTISLPTIAGEIPPDAFADFESQFNVRVVVKNNPLDVNLASPATHLDQHLQGLQRYAESADVLYVTNSTTISPAGLQTNYLLDLQPLASADTSLDTASFVPATWDAFRWNGSLWALPASFETVVIAYNPDAFDAAGLAYPHAGWTLDDYANAARMLTIHDANGAVVTPGFEQSYNDDRFLLALAGTTSVEETQLPARPALNQPALVNVIQTWADLTAEGVVDLSDSGMAGDMQTMGLFNSYEFTLNAHVGAALLPGEQAFLNVNGFAVSSGTQYPELAYELAKHVTSNPEILRATYATYSAQNGVLPAPEIAQPELDQALINARAAPGFSEYLDLAVTEVIQGQPAEITLDNLQLKAIQDLQTAQQVGATTTILVQPPLEINTDGIVLHFSVATSIWPLPNQEQWDSVAEAFANSDAEVSAVVVEAPLTPLEEQLQTYDCFFASERTVLQLDTTMLRSLDPLMDQDPEFIPEDFVGDTLHYLRRDNQTWGFPITLMPRYLKYDQDIFNRDGIPLPVSTWTTNEFEDALHNITDQPAFTRTDSVSIMALIAAYGGKPLDYETDPPTPYFTDPVNVAAIQQVLNLARDGYIDYQSLSTVRGMGQSTEAAAISPVMLWQFGDHWQLDHQEALVNYPAGSQYSVAAFGLGVGYVSASTPYPEACYRWINFASRQPDLFTSMPVRLSVLNQEQARFVVGDIRMDMYQQYVEVLQQSNLITIPFVPLVGSGDRVVLQYWLNRAFDRHVLEGVDLEIALSEAQSYADAYLGCREGDRSVSDCAITIDPETQSILR